MKKMSLALWMVFVMVGCVDPSTITTTSTTASTDHPTTTTTTTTTTMAKLASAENIRILGDLLLWNAIDGATNYRVTLDGVLSEVSQPELSISEKEYGMIEISIVATGTDRLDSDPVVVTLEYAPMLLGVYNIRIVEKILSWDPQPLADRYLISINGNVTAFPIDETTQPEDLFYDLSLLEANEYYSIGVAVGYLEWTSDWSFFLEYDGAFEYSGLFAFTYALSQTDDLVFSLGDETLELHSIEGEGYFEGGALRISYETGTVTFHQSYLEELSYGKKTFLFTTSEGIYEIQIDIVDTRKPYLISSSQIEVALGEDAVVTFELYDGEFVSLSGNDITTDDYTFVGNTLTISGSYIQAIFERDVDRTVLILGYYLTANDHITVGYLFIRIAK